MVPNIQNDLESLIKEIAATLAEMREAELRRYRSWLTRLPEHQRAWIEALSRHMTNALMYRILSELRRANGVERVDAIHVTRLLLGNGSVTNKITSTKSILANQGEIRN